jgi:hypothetical protein
MRTNGSGHSRDSILAELQRSILAEARTYTVQSLHAKAPETLATTLGYKTKIFLIMLPKVRRQLSYGDEKDKRRVEDWRACRRPQSPTEVVSGDVSTPIRML